MRRLLLILPVLIGCVACRNSLSLPDMPTFTYEESLDAFPNPERGFHTGEYFESNNLTNTLKTNTVISGRFGNRCQTLYQHCYYLADYMESDIPQEYIDRMDSNFSALRQGGAKAIIRFSYKYDESEAGQPYDASPEWVHRHIDQLAPVLNRNADVIFSFDAGFIGVWGEWGYSTYFAVTNHTDEEWMVRWEVLNHMLEAFPHDRQIALRTPGYKKRYLRQMGLDVVPLDETTAHSGSVASRISGHNDCFLSSADDWGTYVVKGDREFWQADTRFTNMGGETCAECAYSDGDKALQEMYLYHWTYLNWVYNRDVLDKWQASGHLSYVLTHLGYRLVLENAYVTEHPKAGQPLTVRLTMRNDGFSAPQNPRDVELILMQNDRKYVYKQDIDPRFWTHERESFTVDLTAHLSVGMSGTYNVYLNLPDPYPSLHDNPYFSIRMANKHMWCSKVGYNLLGEITI